MLEAFGSGFLVFAFLATALFQLAIVFGAPLGEYSYGGQQEGKLKLPFRIASAFSALLMFAFAGHYLAQLGIFSTLLPDDLNQLVNWALVGFCALAAISNNITRGPKEKRLWGPVTIAMFAASVLVAL